MSSINCPKLGSGATYSDGTYEYRYNEFWCNEAEDTSAKWELDEKMCGWGVKLIDEKNSNPPPFLTKIEGVPVTSAYSLFASWDAGDVLDITSFDMSEITTTSFMFACCKAKVIDITGIDTSNVKAMYDMFALCSAKEIRGLETLNTSNVTNMSDMFNGCRPSSLNLSSFDTTNVVSMDGMFFECIIDSPLDLSAFRTPSLVNTSRMFALGQPFTVDLSSFDFSTIERTDDMFWGCRANTVDMSSLNVETIKRVWKKGFEPDTLFYQAEINKLLMKDEACIEAMFGDKRVWNGECGPMSIDVAPVKLPIIGTIYTKNGIEYRFGLVWTGLIWETPPYPLNEWGARIALNTNTSKVLKEIKGIKVFTP